MSMNSNIDLGPRRHDSRAVECNVLLDNPQGSIVMRTAFGIVSNISEEGGHSTSWRIDTFLVDRVRNAKLISVRFPVAVRSWGSRGRRTGLCGRRRTGLCTWHCAWTGTWFGCLADHTCKNHKDTVLPFIVRAALRSTSNPTSLETEVSGTFVILRVALTGLKPIFFNSAIWSGTQITESCLV